MRRFIARPGGTVLVSPYPSSTIAIEQRNRRNIP